MDRTLALKLYNVWHHINEKTQHQSKKEKNELTFKKQKMPKFDKEKINERNNKFKAT